jgi:hypothetical protein
VEFDIARGMVVGALWVIDGVHDELWDVRSVKELVGGRIRMERLKRKFERSASRRWGGGELKETLGEDLIPRQLGKAFLEAMNGLAKRVQDGSDAKELLTRAQEGRLEIRGASNDSRLRLGDVKAAMEEAMGQGRREVRIMEVEVEGGRTGGVMDAGRNADLQDEFEFRNQRTEELCVHTKYP